MRGRIGFGVLLVSSAVLACGDVAAPIQQPAPDDEAAAWLRRSAIPFTSTSLDGDLDELEPLRQLIGSARVVALGEATQGTREFYEMRARLLRFLVERMGFNALVVDGSWPEANRLDRYVRTGAGDPVELLSGLYVWMLNTRSMLSTIEWLRAHNSRGGSVGFYGNDGQYPGMAIHSVKMFIAQVDPARSAEYGARLGCLEPYVNNPRGTFPTPGYSYLAIHTRDECLRSLQAVHDTLAARELTYVTRSSRTEYATALHSARIIVQYEHYVSQRRTRDAILAENTLWVLNHLGTKGKAVVFAHNAQVATRNGTMGSALREVLTDGLVTIGFTFRRGEFTAIRQDRAGFHELTTLSAPAFITRSQSVSGAAPYSFEEYFATAGKARFYLDLRVPQFLTDSTTWLQGPRFLRNIRCCYDPERAGDYFYNARLAREFDIVIYFDVTTATETLPFRYPASF